MMRTPVSVVDKDVNSLNFQHHDQEIATKIDPHMTKYSRQLYDLALTDEGCSDIRTVG